MKIHFISSVFCLVYIQLSSSFPADSTELSCSASLEILFSWGWKLHSQGPTTEPVPEVSECSPGFLPLLVQNGFGACLYNICSPSLSRVFNYLPGFLSFQNIFSSCSCIRVKTTVSQKTLLVLIFWKRVCFYWHNLRQILNVQCITRKKCCNNRCLITAWGWVVSRVNISSSRRKRSPTLNETDLYERWYSEWECHIPGPL